MEEIDIAVLFKLLIPIVMIGMAFIVRRNKRLEGRIIKWWVFLVLGMILLIFRLLRIFYML